MQLLVLINVLHGIVPNALHKRRNIEPPVGVKVINKKYTNYFPNGKNWVQPCAGSGLKKLFKLAFSASRRTPVGFGYNPRTVVFTKLV